MASEMQKVKGALAIMAKTKVATFEYKCRRCEVIDSGATGNWDKSLAILMVLSDRPEQVQELFKDMMGISMIGETQIHQCKDGGIGIADIIGMRKGE
jgi:hypothetical protein